MTSPRAASKPTAEATRSRRAASSSSARGTMLGVPSAPVVCTASTSTATLIRLIAPGARSTSRVVSDTSKFTRSLVSVCWLCALLPGAAAPDGRFDATVTAPWPESLLEVLRSCVSVEIATRLVGSNVRSVIASRSVTVSTETSTTALP